MGAMKHKQNIVWWAASVVVFALVMSVRAGEPCNTWFALDSGVEGTVWSMHTHNGELIVGGSITGAGKQNVNHLARWDGNAWQPFLVQNENGVSDEVFALSTYKGDLIVAGEFETAAGQTVNGIARWDGAQWHSLGTGVNGFNNAVTTLTIYKGDLIAAGSFETAGGQMANSIARWDGSQWQALGATPGIGPDTGSIWALTEYAGDLIVAGSFTTAGGLLVNNIARWDGSTWHPLGEDGSSGTNHVVHALQQHNNDLFAGGLFTTAGGQTVNHIARWDGTAWHSIMVDKQIGVNSTVWDLQMFHNNVIAGGTFTTAGGQTVNRIAQWNGTTWQSFEVDGIVGVDGPFGANNSVLAMSTYNDDLIAAGLFTSAGNTPTNRIVGWDSCEDGAPGDLNSDGEVTVTDLLMLLQQWGPCENPDNCAADLDNDDQVSVGDLLILLSNWG